MSCCSSAAAAATTTGNPDGHIITNINNQQEKYLMNLQQLPLAFTSSTTNISNLTSATCRLPFITSDGSATLNVEGFFFGDDDNDGKDSSSNNNGPDQKEKEQTTTQQRSLVLYVHGVCESAETSGVQRLARAAKANGCDLAVLELEGHGLSSGPKCVCGDFDRMIQHVVEFMNHVLTVRSSRSTIKSKTAVTDTTALQTCPPPYVITGTSLGGVLAVYAADIWCQKLRQPSNKQELSSKVLDNPSHFLGVAPIAPAVGVDPRAVPPSLVVGALKLIAALAPSAQLPLTPLEDPSHYNCPKDTTRNFFGHWPLSTSKMLLDVTSRRVVEDQQQSQTLSLARVPSMLVFAGEHDDIVPHDCIQAFYQTAQTMDKELIIIPKAGHDLMFQSSKGKVVTTKLFQWIQLRVSAIEENKSKA